MRLNSELGGSHLGKYRLLERIGSGGMAEVYSARHEGEGGFTKDLVIKMILPGFAEQPKFIELFLNEAKLAAQLSHPNIVQIFDFGSQDGRYFLVMEFVRGLTLRRIKSLAAQSGEPIPVRIAARIMCGAAQGLHYAHELTDEAGAPLGIIHRDVSPDNMIVSRDGIPKLLDFGIAKATSAASATTEGNLKGKYPYMAPELVLGETVDRRLDVYALGVNLYELVTGTKPFVAEDTQVLKLLTQITEEDAPALADSRDDIPEGLQEIVSKAMAKKPSERYANAREMHIALETFLSRTGEAVLEFHTAEYIERLVETCGGSDTSFGRAFETPVSDFDKQPVLPPAAKVASATSPGASSPGSSSASHARASSSSPKVPKLLALATAIAVIAAFAVFFIKSGAEEPEIATGPKPAQAPPIVPAEVVIPTITTPDTTNDPELEIGDVIDLKAIQSVTDAAVPVPDAAEEELVVTKPKKPTPPIDNVAPRDPKGTATLSVRSSPYCTLYVDGKKAGDTPISGLKVKAGKRNLRCENKEQGLERITAVSLAPGESKSETFRFNKGKLVIRVKPWGEVWVDGKRQGVTPFDPVTVFEGSHKIKVVNKDLNVTRTVRARVGSGETKQVKIDLTE